MIWYSKVLQLLTRPCHATGDVKEFGFREVTNQRKDKDTEEVPLQPVPVPPPEQMANPSLTVTICVSGMVSSAEVPLSSLRSPINLSVLLNWILCGVH